MLHGYCRRAASHTFIYMTPASPDGRLGRHLLLELYDCDPHLLNDVTAIESSMEYAATEAGATIINTTFHYFAPWGVSGVVVIQESHLSIHTWPEYGYAAVDVFTCGDTVDPREAAALLAQKLKAERQEVSEIERGNLQAIGREFTPLPQGREPAESALREIRRTRDVWFTERNRRVALSLKHKGDKLFDARSDYQRVEVYDTDEYGPMLALDGAIMCTRQDEYAYHEMIAHVPMLRHPAARRVLVIGGGDGGTVRELLRHEGLEEVVLVEIDALVIEASRKHLPFLSESLDDPRLSIHIADGKAYVQEAAEEAFDLVIVDSNDPVGPSKGLFDEAFYRHAYRILKPEGILITQSESPRFNSVVFRDVYRCLGGIFGPPQVHCYLSFIPTYPTGMWSFSFSSKGARHPVQGLDQERSNAFSAREGLRYYNAAIHQAAFALPPFVQEMLPTA